MDPSVSVIGPAAAGTLPGTPASDSAFLGGGLLLGWIIVAGIVGGHAARLVRVPRVVGYLIAGAALKFALAAAGPANTSLTEALGQLEATAGALDPLVDLALGMILFSIGMVFEARTLRSVGARVARISAGESAAVFALVGLGCGGLAAALLGGPLSERLAVGVLLGAAAVATAPAATLLVLREYEARGPVTNLLLTLTGLNNVTSVLGFHAAFALLTAAGAITAALPAGRLLLWDLAMLSAGSLGAGVLLGVGLSWLHARRPAGETILWFLALLTLLGAGRDWLHERHISLNFLLCCLTMGAVFSNIAIDPPRLLKQMEPLAGPVYVVFFVLAGFNLHVQTLWAGGGERGTTIALIAGYVVLRSAGKLVGVRLTVADAPTQHWSGAGLLCQAGVAIGLASFLLDNWGQTAGGRFVPHEAARLFHTVIIGSVTLFELIGPLGTRWAVVRSGEVKAITLLRRLPEREGPAVPVVALLLRSLRRLVGLGGSNSVNARPLQAEHIMRTNVQCLHADARFPEVLRFVERSHYNDFPVVDDEGRLIGMIHFRDLGETIYDPLMRDLVTAMDLADTTVPLVARDQPLETLHTLFRQRDYGCLPVVDSTATRRVVGIIEQRDLLQALHRLAGGSPDDGGH